MSTPKITPLPWKTVSALCMSIVASSCVATMLFSFVAYMVRDFGMTKDEQRLGYFAGYLASAFYFGQVLSGSFWGWLADRKGRRTSLLLGLCNTFITTLLFGFSMSYPWAVAARVLGGLGSANFAVAKSYISDITDETNRSAGFSKLSLAWGVGSIVGPTIGGYLSEPAKKYSWLSVPLFVKFPYALPCIGSSIVIALSFVLIYAFLPETQQRSRDVLSDDASDVELAAMDSLENETLDSDADRGDADVASEDVTEIPQCSEDQECIQDQPGVAMEADDTKLLASAVESDSVSESNIILSEPQRLHGLIYIVEFIRKHKVLVTCMTMYPIISFMIITYDETFPLFAITKAKDNGLDFTTNNLGTVGFVQGIYIIAVQGFIYTPLARRFGALWCQRAGAIFAISTFLLTPNLRILFGRLHTVANNNNLTSLSILRIAMGWSSRQRFRSHHEWYIVVHKH